MSHNSIKHIKEIYKNITTTNLYGLTTTRRETIMIYSDIQSPNSPGKFLLRTVPN